MQNKVDKICQLSLPVYFHLVRTFQSCIWLRRTVWACSANAQCTKEIVLREVLDLVLALAGESVSCDLYKLLIVVERDNKSI